MKTKILYTITGFMLNALTYAQEVPVVRAEIPSEARHFLSDHFKSPFHHAIKDIERNTITYEVVLNDNTEIEFDSGGNWKEVDGKGKAIPYTFIQKQIIDYVKSEYPKEIITKIEVEPDKYEVELSNGLDLRFNAMGAFIKLD